MRGSGLRRGGFRRSGFRRGALGFFWPQARDGTARIRKTARRFAVYS